MFSGSLYRVERAGDGMTVSRAWKTAESGVKSTLRFGYPFVYWSIDSRLKLPAFAARLLWLGLPGLATAPLFILVFLELVPELL